MHLNCKANELTALGTENCPDLKFLDCDWNNIASLNLKKSIDLTDLTCNYNKLKSLDISQNKKMVSLICEGNPGENNEFIINLWKGSRFEAKFKEWYYNGQTVTIKYTGR